MYRVKSTLFFSDDVKQCEISEKLRLLKMVHPKVFEAFIEKCKNPKFFLHDKQKEILQRWSPSYQSFVLDNGTIPELVRTLVLNELGQTKASAKGDLIRARL